jgi:membrane associated rhomboid family serine protease
MKFSHGARLLLITTILIGLAMLFTPGHNHSNDMTLPFIVCALTALLFCLLSGLAFGAILLFTTGGFVLALIFKIIVDGYFDPNSHNLFPFEIVISGTVAFVAAVIGAATGLLLKRLKKVWLDQKRIK